MVQVLSDDEENNEQDVFGTDLFLEAKDERDADVWIEALTSLIEQLGGKTLGTDSGSEEDEAVRRQRPLSTTMAGKRKSVGLYMSRERERERERDYFCVCTCPDANNYTSLTCSCEHKTFIFMHSKQLRIMFTCQNIVCPKHHRKTAEPWLHRFRTCHH